MRIATCSFLRYEFGDFEAPNTRLRNRKMPADPGIATAADYADALYTSRLAKNALVLILLLLLITQIGLFFLVRKDVINIATPGSTTQAFSNPADKLHYIVAATCFLGVTLSIVLSFVLLLVVNIMLVGRLIGVARLTSAYVWCLILIVLLFPWQAFLNDAALADPKFKIPGVLYTWDELKATAHFPSEVSPESLLKWARYVVFPGVAVILLLMIQIKSNRGIRQAFGETDDLPAPAPLASEKL